MDTHSEEWRHECEARTALNMPLLKRQAHLTAVEGKRGTGERRRLEGTMRRIWMGKQLDQLMGMSEDERAYQLGKIERATNPRLRADLEAALGRKLAANDNHTADLFGETERAV